MVAFVRRLDCERAVVDLACPPIDRDRAARESVERALAATDDARQAQRATDDSSMGRTAAQFRDDSARCDHAVQVVRAGCRARKNDRLARMRAPLGLVGVANENADAHAGRGALAGGKRMGAMQSLLADVRRKQDHDLLGRDPAESCVYVDQPFSNEIDGDADCGMRSKLGRARLQEKELSTLDGELDVLNILAGALEGLRRDEQGCVSLRQFIRERRQRLRRELSRHDIFTLRPRKVFSVGRRVAGQRITREKDASARAGVEIAEHHRLDRHRCPEIVGDAVVLAIAPGAAGVP